MVLDHFGRKTTPKLKWPITKFIIYFGMREMDNTTLIPYLPILCYAMLYYICVFICCYKGIAIHLLVYTFGEMSGSFVRRAQTMNSMFFK